MGMVGDSPIDLCHNRLPPGFPELPYRFIPLPVISIPNDRLDVGGSFQSGRPLSPDAKGYGSPGHTPHEDLPSYAKGVQYVSVPPKGYNGWFHRGTVIS